MFRKLAELTLIFRWPFSFILILITIATASTIADLRIDPSMETLFMTNTPDYKLYDEYRSKYGNDQMIAVAMAVEDVFTLKNLLLVKTLTEEIAKIPAVERVVSLANVMDIEHKFMGVQVVPLWQEHFFHEPGGMQKLRQKVLSNELYLQNIISEDGKIANILVYLKITPESRSANGFLIKKLREYLRTQEHSHRHFYVAGSPVEQYDFIDLIRRDQLIFVPVITLLLIVTTLLIYRSFACMFASMSIVFMTVIWTLGTIALAGVPLNLMTSLLAPVIMIVSVANSIHIMNHFFEVRLRTVSIRKAVIDTMDQLGVPCFLTQITTVLGFISLAYSPVPAIRSFGIFSALGTFYAYIIELFLTPMLLPILPYKKAHKEPGRFYYFFQQVVISFLERLEFRWKWWILAATALLLGFSYVGFKNLEVDSNLVKQMKPNLPLAVSTRFIDQYLTGVYSMAFVIRRHDGRPMTDYESLEKLDEFKKYLEDLPAITKVNSITTLIKKINQAAEGNEKAYQIPKDEGRLEKFFEGIGTSQDPELWKMISHDFTEVNLGVRIKAVGTKEGFEVEERARQYIKKHLKRTFHIYQTGNIVLLGRMSTELVNEQMQSFGFAFLSILAIICISFRSIAMGLFASIPSLIPIAFVYGLMGFLHIELSSTTAMISSIVLGMVVDNAIHFLHRFREEFEGCHQYIQALHNTLRDTGQALIVSTIILVAGFGSSVFANFKPTIYFGLLTSLTIFLSLVSTVVILPVCLVLFKPFGPQRLFSRKKPG